MKPSAGLSDPTQDPAWSMELEFPEAIPAEAERLRTKVDVEFVL